MPILYPLFFKQLKLSTIEQLSSLHPTSKFEVFKVYVFEIKHQEYLQEIN